MYIRILSRRIPGMWELFHHLRSSVIRAVNTATGGRDLLSWNSHQKLPCTPCWLARLLLAQPSWCLGATEAAAGGDRGGAAAAAEAIPPPYLSSLPLAWTLTPSWARDLHGKSPVWRPTVVVVSHSDWEKYWTYVHCGNLRPFQGPLDLWEPKKAYLPWRVRLSGMAKPCSTLY